MALDGELWLGRGKFQQCISIVRRQDRLESAWADVKYVVFDAPKAAGGIGARLKAAKAAVDGAAAAAAGQIVGGVAVEVLAHEVCKGRAHVNEKLAAVEAAGGEGVMLRHPTAPHRPGRTARDPGTDTTTGTGTGTHADSRDRHVPRRPKVTFRRDDDSSSISLSTRERTQK